MKAITEFVRTSIGMKVVMAITGLILFLFVIGHMIGNLKIFSGINPATGEYKIDEYAVFLREMGSPALGHGQALWIFRIVLLIALIAHVVCAWVLTRRSHSARSIQYGRYAYDSSTYSARTMRWGGVIILCYLVYHLLHLTFGSVHSEIVEHGRVYHNLIMGFQVWYISLAYIVANLVLGLHLSHGLWSLCQTLGLGNPEASSLVRCGARGVSLVVVLGYISVPLSIMFGLLS
ncbi:MAG: succinate dehydrogenase cytochrome b subunit [Bdellovibrionales bacterium]|nr:succinate dehydrogenase cytochrome b subunit [Bdellovibrionales bacterium]